MSDEPFEFQLSNGMTIQYCSDNKWSFGMLAKTHLSEGIDGERECAANHLIEHTIFRNTNAYTRSSYIFYGYNEDVPDHSNDQNLLKIINKGFEAFNNIKLENISSEKERICEEWGAGMAQTPDKFCYLSGMMEKVGLDVKDRSNPNITQEQGFDWLNRQADYTRDFTDEELLQQAKFVHSAENLIFRVSGLMTNDEFKSLIEKSKLSEIPRHHNGAARLSSKSNVKSTVDYRNVKAEKTLFKFKADNQEDEKIRDRLMKKLASNLSKDPMIYWLQRNMEEDGWKKLEITATDSKTEKIKEQVLSNLEQFSHNGNEDEARVAGEMFKQAQKQVAISKNLLNLRKKMNKSEQIPEINDHFSLVKNTPKKINPSELKVDWQAMAQKVK